MLTTVSKRQQQRQRRRQDWKRTGKMAVMALTLLGVVALLIRLRSHSTAQRVPVQPQATPQYTYTTTLNYTEAMKKTRDTLQSSFTDTQIALVPTSDDLRDASKTLIQIAHMTYRNSVLQDDRSKADRYIELQKAVNALPGTPQLVRDTRLGQGIHRVKYGSEEYVVMRTRNNDMDALRTTLPAEHFMALPLTFQSEIDGTTVSWAAGKLQGEAVRLPTRDSRHTAQQVHDTVHAMLLALKDVNDRGYYYDLLDVTDMRRIQDGGKERYVAMAVGLKKIGDSTDTEELRYCLQARGITRYISAHFDAEVESSSHFFAVSCSWKKVVKTGMTQDWWQIDVPVGSDALFDLLCMLTGVCKPRCASVEEALGHPYITGMPFTPSDDDAAKKSIETVTRN